jgi:hypothetical protein
MNCKQGDLAYVFKSQRGNYGKIVTCLELMPKGFSPFYPNWENVWRIDKKLLMYFPHIGMDILVNYANDYALRSLRGDLSGDEIEQKQPIASVFTA